MTYHQFSCVICAVPFWSINPDDLIGLIVFLMVGVGFLYHGIKAIGEFK